MKKSVLLALALLLTPGPALADSVAQQANELLVLQFADCYTTQRILKLPGVVELDPLARPFTHSVRDNMIPAIVINVALRILWHKKPKMFRYADEVEGAFIVNNLAVWRAYSHLPAPTQEKEIEQTHAGTRTRETR